jgi:formamidopyrimidine-DNA glycosylase
MPELPEVETVKNGLNRLLPGKKILDIWHDWVKSFPNSEPDVKAFLIGARAVEVKRRAKVLLIELDSKYSLVIHLKMTGQLVYRANDNSARFGAGHPSDSLIDTLPDRSTRVVFVFGDSKLYFNDQRKFGWVRLLPTAEVPNIDFFRKVGPEPLAADFTANDFILRLNRRPKSNVKAVLLDQTVIAGVGNIYADESLFAARIHPDTLVKDLSKPQLTKLFNELQAVLNLSIEKGGSSDKNYVNAEGKKGSYLTFAQVFRKQGQPCPRCGSPIEKIRVAARGTHICPTCQKVS